ncbi:MAG: NADH-quinone oxidoreductase subunit N [Pirellulaceae bacterium]|nr:NADH-quinone oxidoreductase subunit N [Pirellulaceae bacterium]
MELHEIVSDLIIDTKGLAGGLLGAPTNTSSIALFLPELVVCATILLMLLVRLFRWGRTFHSFYVAVLGCALALAVTQPQQLLAEGGVPRIEIFTGMLVFDGFTVFLRTILLAFTVLFLILTKISGIPDREDGGDIYTLVLGAVLGMCLMASSNHLLMVFMSIEMASVPSYALAGLLKGRRLGSEAALKYSVYGAGAAGVMLYGISLLAGLVNTVHLPTMGVELAQRLPTMAPPEYMVLALAGMMVMVGLAFKLSAVPFHFWCPDVFEGAPAEVGAFLSVASKAAALALLVRVAIGLSAIVPPGLPAGQPIDQAAQTAARDLPGLFAVADEKPADNSAIGADPRAALQPMRSLLGKLIAVLAIITCTFGNLAAYGQTNIKRLLAYSTIAHAGYMMMAVPALIALAGQHPQQAQNAVSGLGIYIALYLFMNLGAFAIVAFFRNAFRSEEIADYAGLIRRCPGMVICFAAILFSLVGLPPLSGFIGKFAVFAALMDGFRLTGETYLLIVLLAGGINTAISLFYYLRVVKVMTMEPESPTRVPFALPMLSAAGMFTIAITLPTLLLILWWNWINESALGAARHLLT